MNEDEDFKGLIEHADRMAARARFAQHPAMGHQHTPRKNWLAGSMWDAQAEEKNLVIEGTTWDTQKFSFHTSDPNPTSTNIPVFRKPEEGMVSSDYIGGGQYVINGNANVAYVEWDIEGYPKSNTAIGPEPKGSDDIADYW